MSGRKTSGKDDWPLNSYSHGIVSCYCVVKKHSKSGSAVRTVHVGTLIEIHGIQKDDVLFCIVKSNTPDSDLFQCKKADILFVPENLWGPLLAVKENKRLPIVQCRELAEALGNLTIGSSVKVLGNDNKDVCIGTITFKNSITKLGVGVYFGLRIKNPKDDMHFIMKNFSLLEPGTKGFPRGCDIVVSADRVLPLGFDRRVDELLRLEDQKYIANNDRNVFWGSKFISDSNDKNESNLKSSHHGNGFDSNLPDSESRKKRFYNIPISKGEKVVFLNGNKPEIGTVKWLGCIRNSMKIGVEFENPIGSGTGSVDGVEFFRTKYLHAGFFPPEALIKLSDFTMDSSGEFHYQKNVTNNNNYDDYNHSRIKDGSYWRWVQDFGGSKPVKKNKLKYLDYPNSVQRTGYLFNCYDENGLDGESDYCSSYTTECSDCLSYTDYVIKNSDTKGYERKYFNYDFNFKDNNLPPEKKYVRNPNVELVSVGTSPNPEFLDSFNQDWKDGCGSVGDDAYKDLDVEDLNVTKSENEPGSSQPVQEADPPDNDPQVSEGHNPVPSTDEENEECHNAQIPNAETLPSEQLGQGSVVEFLYKGQPFYGVIRWIGSVANDGEPRPRLIAGIEMEEERQSFTDGTFLNQRYFDCDPNKALFIPLSECRKDSRFLEQKKKRKSFLKIRKNSFGELNCPVIQGAVPPINQKSHLELICGKNRGIQGHHNSCYLDATLFSMFAFTCVFDSLLFRPPNLGDIPQYLEVQRVLKEEIVNPLRKNLYVRADRVMKLRTLLENLSSVSGLTSEEKDPEEFLQSLLAQILKAEPFLKLNSGQETFFYQLFIDRDKRLTFPSVQQLFEQSFFGSDLKLNEIPSCLIIQMPRFGKLFKMYPRIYPPQILDITDVLDNSPRQCTVCGKLAEYECRDCFGQNGIGNGLESISFCESCLFTAHNHHLRMSHQYRDITVPFEFYDLQEHSTIPRIYMELFAVVCIETSHYVAFVKCGTGVDAPWCFFDSMADRQGEQNGYNIPEIVPCPDLPYWLSEEGAKALNEMKDDRQLPELAKRLLCDAYICMYQSEDVMMYK